MSDNELLLALSDMIDKKLDSRLEPMKADMQSMKERLEILGIKQDLTHKKLDNLTLDVKASGYLAHCKINGITCHHKSVRPIKFSRLPHSFGWRLPHSAK